MKDFASYTDLSKNGFALSGFTGDYSGGFFTQKKFGIGGNIRYASLSIDENALLELMAAEFPAEFPLSEQPSYTTGFWKYVAVLAGPEYTIPRNKANIDLYLMTGINFVLPPEMAVYAVNQDDYYERKTEIKTINLGLEGGCALRYHISEYTSIRFHASWFISTCYGDIIHRMEIQGDLTSDKNAYSCIINTLNAGIGIAYRL
jgi:hypothetical protein